jgi:hypothetical protein
MDGGSRLSDDGGWQRCRERDGLEQTIHGTTRRQTMTTARKCLRSWHGVPLHSSRPAPSSAFVRGRNYGR